MNTKQNNTLNLSKKLIINLPVFMETAVKTLTAFTDLKAKKLGHSIKKLDKSVEEEVINAVMRFNGDIKGSFVLIFPIDIAVMAMESLLGEEIDRTDIETLKDGVGEFCNIITGSIKTALVDKGIEITFALPRKYISMSSTSADIGKNNGVWVDMQLAEQNFYMFVCS